MTDIAVAPDVMPRLPAAYAPFAPVLERLSEPLQLLLHGQLLQFETLVRNVDAPEFAPQGEFEGLGGLTMRGDIAQLVQSELLLRTEAPLEFLRRIADSETLYLEKQYADPGARPVFRVMISVGPAILGHGRLLALAALLFMARVALSRGAAFHWCFLPRNEGAVWFDEVSVNTIKRFLRAAARCEMTGEDVAAAHDTWNGLMTGGTARPVEDYRDWVIAGVAHGAAKAGSALAQAVNALTFAVSPPRPGERRLTTLSIRRNRREATQRTIAFPDDRVCVSALKSPFAPLKPSDVALLATAPRGAMPGWAPEYFVILRTDTRVIRMPGGLLVLTCDSKLNCSGRWFIRLPADARLAGVGLNGNLLAIVTNSARSGVDTMYFHQVRLADARSTAIAFAARREVPSEHLFKRQRDHALPSLGMALGAEVYGVSGQAFDFQFATPGNESRFTMLHGRPRILYSNGVHRVVQIEQDGTHILRVVKHRQSGGDDFAVDQPLQSDRIFGMVYSSAQRSLAYSAAPNVWTFPPRFPPSENPAAASDRLVDRDLELAPPETLLSGHISGMRLSARIWSDARHGGAGTVRSIRREHGETIGRQPLLRLGDDAPSIAKILVADDGIWAVRVDVDDVPTEMLAYRSLKKHSHFKCTRFDLGELVAQAVTIEIGANDG